MGETVRFPEYEPDARFKCASVCGLTFARHECATHNGRLICPKCRYIGTLAYQPAIGSQP